MMKSKSIKTNIIYNIIKTCSSVVFPLITFPYISRVLSPENIGKYDFSNSIVSYFSLIASLGISTYAIRECSAARDNQVKLNQVSSQIYSINIFTTIFSYLLLGLTLIFFDKLKDYRLLIGIRSVSIVMATVGADWINSAMEDFKYITIRTFCFQIVSLILMFLFVKHPKDYIIYSIISLISISGANLINIFYRKKYCKIKFTWKIDWRTHFPSIMLLFVMLLSQSILNNADKTMLGIMRNDYEVGIYSTALKVTQIIQQIVLSILWVVMPRLSLLFANNDYGAINKFLRYVLGIILIIGLPCFVGGFSISEEIILCIAGNDYIEAVPVLRILLLSILISFFGGGFIGNMIMLPSRKERVFTFVCLISMILNVILNGILIPYIGAIGASIATVASEMLTLILLFFQMDKQIKIVNISSLAIGPFIGSFGIVIVCFIMKALIKSLFLRTFVCIIGSITIYSICLIITKNEIALSSLNNIINKIRR